MSEDSINKIVVTILEKHGACLHHEIADRAWYEHRKKFRSTVGAIERLFSKRIIDRKVIESPYGKPFHFYFLAEADSEEIEPVIKYKLRLLQHHAKLTDQVGRFGEHLIGRIIDDLQYEEVEIRKEKHDNVGLRRMDIDVWGKHLYGYYQNIEVKNRRQPVNVDDVEDVISKTKDAIARWSLPVESALVCSFIYTKALKKARSANMPVAITKKVFVPRKYAKFYLNYRKTLGSRYIEIADSENPSDSLSDLILDVIHDHDYDE